MGLRSKNINTKKCPRCRSADYIALSNEGRTVKYCCLGCGYEETA